MKYTIKMSKKHGLEVHTLTLYTNSGQVIRSHQYMSRAGCESKLFEIKLKLSEK